MSGNGFRCIWSVMTRDTCNTLERLVYGCYHICFVGANARGTSLISVKSVVACLCYQWSEQVLAQLRDEVNEDPTRCEL